MALPSSPKPFLAVVAALVAHVAYLLAPDVQEPLWIILLYGVAAVTVLMAMAWLRGGGEIGNGRLRLRSVVAGGFVDVLLFVGAGYCTSVEPGVIKLGGVLPLGWSCAALVLIDGLIQVFSSTTGKVADSPLNLAQGQRWLVLAIGTAIALAERLMGEEPRGLKGMLTAMLFYSAYTCWRRYRATVQRLAAETPKE